MKYFKPELLARYRSPDEAVAQAANTEWDRATEAYNARREEIQPSLPAGVRRLLERFSLHDATLLGVTLTKRPAILSLLVRLEGGGGRAGMILQLTYATAQTERRSPLSVVRGTDGPLVPGRILYDEFARGRSGSDLVFSHRLLLASGGEVRVRFTDLGIRRVKRVLLPVVEDAGADGARPK